MKILYSLFILALFLGALMAMTASAIRLSVPFAWVGLAALVFTGAAAVIFGWPL